MTLIEEARDYLKNVQASLWYRSLLERFIAEHEALRCDIERHVEIAAELATEVERLRAELVGIN